MMIVMRRRKMTSPECQRCHDCDDDDGHDEDYDDDDNDDDDDDNAAADDDHDDKVNQRPVLTPHPGFPNCLLNLMRIIL